MKTCDLQAYRLVLGKDVFTSGQVAGLFGMSTRMAVKMIDRGDIKGHCFPGSKDRRVYRADLIRFARDAGLPLPLPFETKAVACLVADPTANDHVSPVRLGALLTRAEVSAVLVGCEDGLAAAVRLAREVRAEDPGVRLTLLRADDTPAGAVPAGVFDAVVTTAAAWAEYLAKKHPTPEPEAA